MTATLDRLPAGQLPAGVPLPEQLLTTLPSHRPMAIAHEIAALREAVGCITPDTSADQLRGRLDTLIGERTTELLGYYARAVDAGMAAAEAVR